MGLSFYKDYNTQFTEITNDYYNLGKGLRRFKAAMAKLNSGTTAVYNICFLGDSITEGTGSGTTASDYLNKGFVGRIRTELASKFGDVGRGMIPIYYTYASALWTFSGTGWADDIVYGCCIRSKKTSTNGDTATFSFNGTGISIVVLKGSLTGTFSASIDGGGSTVYDTYNATTINAASIDITGLSAGDHTIVITKSNDGKPIYIHGAYEIKGTSGFRVNMVGRYGTKTSNASPVASMDAEITYWQPVLTVISYVANDIGLGTDLTTYKSNLQTMITKALLYGDVLLIGNGIQTNISDAVQLEYINVLKTLSREKGVAFIDIFNRWGGSSEYANTTLQYLSDNVHPNPAGHQDIATSVINALLYY